MDFKELENLVNEGKADGIQSSVEGFHAEHQESKKPKAATKVEFTDYKELIGEATRVSAKPVEREVLADSHTDKEKQEALNKSKAFIPDPRLATGVQGFDFEDPYELLLFLDDDLLLGMTDPNGVKLHPWQIQKLEDFAIECTEHSPYQALVRACNGSGKDKYIIAPCAVWLLMKYVFSRAIVTSSSGVQLDNQTDAYINQLCRAANRKIHPKTWKINYRYYECLPTQSPMVLFATDEPGKAEGYHPLKHGAKMAIFVSEDKTVPDEINLALNKCTGYTHRVHVSTPGIPNGHFFDMCQLAVKRKLIHSIKEVTPIDYIEYHITAYDCPHISRNYIEQMKRDLPGGESGPAFRSQILAEFGSTDEMVVIPSHYVWLAHNSMPKIGWIKETFNTAGLDLSAGGDETALVVRNGNKVIKVDPFRFQNTEDTIDYLQTKFREYELVGPQCKIFADCVGIGKPMLDRLVKLGWTNIRYIDSRHAARRPKVYLNRGTELWFNTASFFQRHEIIIPKDPILIKQLAGRYYKLPSSGKHQLLTKVEQKSKGFPSPDRADALNLAFWNYQSNFVDNEEVLKAPFESPKEEKPKGDFDPRAWANGNQNSLPNPSAGRDFSVLQEALREHNLKLSQHVVVE